MAVIRVQQMLILSLKGTAGLRIMGIKDVYLILFVVSVKERILTDVTFSRDLCS